MHEHDLCWANGDSYLDLTNWHIYEEDTVYYSEGTYGSKSCAYRNDRIILKWSDYM